MALMTDRSRNTWINDAVGEVIVTGNVGNTAAYHEYPAGKWGV